MRLCDSMSHTRAKEINGVGAVGLSLAPMGVSGLRFCDPNTSAPSRWELRVQNSSPLGMLKRTFCNTIGSLVH